MKENPIHSNRITADSIRTPSGEALYTELHTPSTQPQGTVVLVHGFAEHLGRYQHVMAHLVSKGFQVLAYDQRGHGRSTGERSHIGSFEDYRADLEAVMEKAYGFGLPTYLLSHSMGALVSLLYLSTFRNESCLKAAVFIGVPLKPSVEVPHYKHFLGLILGRFAPHLQFTHEVNPHDLSRNESIGKQYMNDPLVNHKVSAGWYIAFLATLETLPLKLGGIKVPALFLHGREDRVAHPDGSRVIYQSYPALQKQLHIYEGCFHELLNEDCYPSIVDEIDQWFRHPQQSQAKVVSVGS